VTYRLIKLECLSPAKVFSVDVTFVASALPTNIRLGWKGLPGTNTLAYYENLQLTAVKSFITFAPALSTRNLELGVSTVEQPPMD